MAPTPPITTITPILNTTCAALHTSNFKVPVPPTTNLTATCSLPPLHPPKDTSFSSLWIFPIFLGIITLGILIYLLICFLFRYPRYKLITDLRNTPSYQLHEKVERLYAYYHDLENDERFKKGQGGRIQDVRTEVNREEMTRMVIVQRKK
ncbi:hypothetical protein DL98DRAFT_570220 [Cadophora sp. DSE1049]|nr:hypothetical protein DL98DRAFT_570220 [Cadophora sp. DSE1049]